MVNTRDSLGRTIDYLRISITDRCNLRCRYCMPETGVDYKSHESILRYEEIEQIVRTGVELGIKKVRITGGEPLVRKGVIDFVKILAQIDSLQEISMTTNGILLGDQAQALKDAGLQRVNISLDTLNRKRYKKITGFDGFNQAFKGIKKALEVGLTPVKINMVVMQGINDQEIYNFIALADKLPLQIRFIEYMPMGEAVRVEEDHFISLTEIIAKIKGKYKLIPTKTKGNGPAVYYKTPDSKGTIGFITPLSHTFCQGCNRLRLTADGKLKPCLAHNLEIDLHDEHNNLLETDELRLKLKQAILIKPDSHNFFKQERSNRNMFQIGG